MTDRSVAELAAAHVRSGRLANGVAWVSWHDPRDPVASSQVWVRTGSSHERPGHTGLAHMLEHLMFRGTRTCPDGGFDAAMDAMGAQINASTWLDYTAYTATFEPASLRRVLELEADRFGDLAITDEVFAAEREVVANERRQQVDADPVARMDEIFMQRVWGDGGYGWPTIGWADDIAAYTRDAVAAFWTANYATDRICVVVAGPIPADEVEAVVEATFGALTRRGDAHPPVRIDECTPTREVIRLPLRAPRICLGWRAPGRLDPAWPAWLLTRDLLAGAESARLPVRLELQDHVALDCSAMCAGHRHGNLFEVELTPRQGIDPARVEAIAFEEIRRLAEEGPRPDELLGALRRLRRYELSVLRTTSGRADAIGTSWIHAGDPTAGFSLVDAMGMLTADDVRAVARHLADPGTCWSMTALPEAAS